MSARKNPPKITAAQRRHLADPAATPDSKIRWTRPGALISSENKRQVTLRLDADVLDFFKSTGSRYQSRINAVLREYVNAHVDTA